MKTIELSSVHLIYLDGDDRPAGGGSGCLLDYFGQRYLITVYHVADIPTGHRIELDLGWDPASRKTLLKDPGAVFAAPTSVRLEEEGKVNTTETDFAFYKVPYLDVPPRQIVDPSGTIISSTPITIFTESSLSAPQNGVHYGFAGHTRHRKKWDPKIAKDVHLLSTQFQTHYELTFEEQVGEFYTFKLPFAHPGHEYFRGCSGAPILDIGGNIVAFVSHGFDDEDKIYGVPANRYRMMMDVSRLLNQHEAGGKPYLEDYKPAGSWL